MRENTRFKKNFEQQGMNWYADRFEAVKVERNRYFFLLMVCLVALILSVIANLLLSPLKTTVPYVIEVDHSNGTTSVLKAANSKALEANQAVTVYFLYKYLNARMSYDFGLRKLNAAVVRALSSAATFTAYVKEIDADNPNSPIRRYADRSQVHVKILGYSFPYSNIAQIHFYTELVNASMSAVNTPNIKQYKLATIKYTYANVPIPADDRENINPLGFFVTSFQVNDETPEVK